MADLKPEPAFQGRDREETEFCSELRTVPRTVSPAPSAADGQTSLPMPPGAGSPNDSQRNRDGKGAESPPELRALARATARLDRTDVRSDAHHLGPIRAIGVALPGLISADRQRLRRCVNLPFLEGRDLAEDVRQLAGAKPALFTDADAATWGEYAAISPRPERFVHLRIGTGVALGAVIDGAIHAIEPGRTTHSTLLVIDERHAAVPCECGLRGCLEGVASGRAIEASARAGPTTGASALSDALRRCDPLALALVERIGRAVAAALAQVTASLDPEVILLGGGVIEHLPHLFEAVEAAWRRPPAGDPPSHPETHARPAIRRAALGGRAGAVGAALLGASMR